jgi:hypothetical protein
MEESHGNGNSNVNGNVKQQAIGMMRNASYLIAGINIIVERHNFTNIVVMYLYSSFNSTPR